MINERLEKILPLRGNKAEVDINSLAYFHAKVCNFCENVNKCYGVALVVCAIHSFVAALLVFNRIVSNDFDWWNLISVICTWTFRFSELFCTLFACESVSNEVSYYIFDVKFFFFFNLMFFYFLGKTEWSHHSPFIIKI